MAGAGRSTRPAGSSLVVPPLTITTMSKTDTSRAADYFGAAFDPEQARARAEIVQDFIRAEHELFFEALDAAGIDPEDYAEQVEVLDYMSAAISALPDYYRADWLRITEDRR